MKQNDRSLSVYPSIRDLFSSADVQRQLEMAVPKIMDKDRLVRVALTVIRTNPKLLECSRESLLVCLMGSAQLGLSPEPYLGQVYFVPFWNSKLNKFEAQMMPGYRGYITLARRSGQVANIAAQAVFKNDYFKIQYGLNPVLDHIPADGDRGEFKGAWTVFNYRNGMSPTFDYMNHSDIDKIKERSKSRDKKGDLVGPWLTDYEEMSKKTVIRRHIKIAPMEIEDRLALAAQAENNALEGIDQRGLFMPDEKPIEISGRPALPGPDPVAVFGDLLKDPEFKDFVGAVAKHNSITEEEVLKSGAVQEDFIPRFKAWKERKPRSKPKDETEAKKADAVEPNAQDPMPSPPADTAPLTQVGGVVETKPETQGQEISEDQGKDTGMAESGPPAGDGSSVEDESIRADLFEKLNDLKMKYPKVYLKTVKGLKIEKLGNDGLIEILDKLGKKIGGDAADERF